MRTFDTLVQGSTQAAFRVCSAAAIRGAKDPVAASLIA